MKLSIKGQGHSLILVKGHSDFKVKCLTFGLYTQVSDSGPPGPLVKISDGVSSGQSCTQIKPYIPMKFSHTLTNGLQKSVTK